MVAKRHERTRARRGALQVLYTSEIQGLSAAAIAADESCLSDEGPLSDYAQMLVRGVEGHQFHIDKQLVSTSENWALSRMPIVDRCILRLATYEMLFIDDVPVSVSINEAVELAKDFGGEDESSRFVNGILGRIAKQIEAGTTVLSEPEPAIGCGEEKGDSTASEPEPATDCDEGSASAASADEPGGEDAPAAAIDEGAAKETAFAEAVEVSVAFDAADDLKSLLGECSAVAADAVVAGIEPTIPQATSAEGVAYDA